MELCGKLWGVDGGGCSGRASQEPMDVRGGWRPASAVAEMQACSGCAGDYEDPDRTAGEEFEAMLAGEDTDEGEIQFEE